MKETTRNSGVKRQESSLDRISSLPYDIRLHILSFLPTKDSVATSVLSSKWQCIWRYTRNLHFIQSGDGLRRKTDKNNATYMKFANFVTRVLLLHDVRCIDKFCFEFRDERMVYDQTAMTNINNWFATVVARNIMSVDLSGYHHSASQFQLPNCIFSCASLEKLDLSDIVALSPPSVCLLPSLRILHLKRVSFKCDESLCKLLSGCASLHTLYVDRRKRDNVATFTVRSLTLKNLTISSSTVHGYPRDSKLEINAPALEYVHLNDPLSGDFSVKKFPLLVEATIKFGSEVKESHDRWSSFGKLINELDNAKVLSLDASAVRVVEHFGYPFFPRLTELTLCHCCGYHSLLKLLQRSHLETLILKLSYCYHRVHGSWAEPESVPFCVLYTLKVVSIDGFYGREDQLAMVNYILQNASILDTMGIKAGHMNVNEALKLYPNILNSERKSKKCEQGFCSVRLPLLKILSLKNVGFGCDESVRKLLRGCLSLHTLNVVRRSDGLVTGVPLIILLQQFGSCILGLSPIFLRLTELALDHCCGYNSLLKLLDSCSTMEILVLKRNRHHSVHENWTKPKRVPVCILSRLKVVSINEFYGREDQLAMVDYILQNC